MNLSVIVEKWDGILYQLYNWLARIYFYFQYFSLKNKLQKNKKLKGLYQNKRCVVLMNGPSINSMDLSFLEKEVVICANYFFRSDLAKRIRPDYLCWLDSAAFIKETELKKEIREKCPGIKMIFNIKGYSGEEEDVYYTYNKHLPNLYSVENNLAGFSSGFTTVAFYAINVAIYMGFSEIYLLGLDFEPAGFRHFTDLGAECDNPRLKNRKIEVCGEYWSYAKAHYEAFAINEFAKKKGVRIINCNKNSYIRAFEFGNIN